MLTLPIYQVDAFSARPFAGNPAAVVPLEQWLPDQLLQDIAGENNLSETAFFVPEGEGLHIRWFTPTTEVDLCGHATLAAAWVLFHCLGRRTESLVFRSRGGELRVSRVEGQLALDLPVEVPLPGEIDDAVVAALGAAPREVWAARYTLLVYDREVDVRALRPDFGALLRSGSPPVIATAPGEQVDFVSRFFAPGAGIDEDPVTGSAHAILAPYWAQRLGREALTGRQLSPRGGAVSCRLRGTEVSLLGECALYLQGTIQLADPVPAQR